MSLSEQEQAFLARRAKLLKAWPYADTTLLITLIGFSAHLFWRVPMLANPYAALARIEANSVPASTMMLSAVLLPILFVICMILASAIVLCTFAHLANAREYLRIIQNITKAASSSGQ
jgi:hypothetical protein